MINNPDEIRQLTQETVEKGGGVIKFTKGSDLAAALALMKVMAPKNSITRIRRMWGDNFVVMTEKSDTNDTGSK